MIGKYRITAFAENGDGDRSSITIDPELTRDTISPDISEMEITSATVNTISVVAKGTDSYSRSI